MFIGGLARMDREADVAIVGAGPAGASAAIRLVRGGRRVILIDRKHFPREKVCGGCLSGRTVARLRELIGEGRDLPGVEGTRVTFVVGKYRLTCRPSGATRVVHRAELDAFLVTEALAAGAVGMFGEAAAVSVSEPGTARAGSCLQSLEASGGRDLVVRVGGGEVRAGTVLIAAGVGGLASRIGGVGRGGAARMMAQQWVQPSGPGLPELGAVELHWLRGGYVGLASPREGDCVVALAARVDEDAVEGEGAFERLRRLNPDFALCDVLSPDAPRRYGARGAAGFPWMPQRLGVGEVILIGDAAGYEEPYTGEGIGQALLSAECATNAIMAGGDILGVYGDLMRRRHRPVVRRTWWISRFLQTPLLGWLAGLGPALPAGLLARIVERVHVRGAT